SLVRFSISAPLCFLGTKPAEFGARAPLVTRRNDVGGRPFGVQLCTLRQRCGALLLLRDELGAVGTQWHFLGQHVANEFAVALELNGCRNHADTMCFRRRASTSRPLSRMTRIRVNASSSSLLMGFPTRSFQVKRWRSSGMPLLSQRLWMGDIGFFQGNYQRGMDLQPQAATRRGQQGAYHPGMP